MLLTKFWQSITTSQIHFIADSPLAKNMIESNIGIMKTEITKGQKSGKSTPRYFELLEEITHKLIKIHGFEVFAEVYHTEKAWIKTEIKNTLNFAFMSEQN